MQNTFSQLLNYRRRRDTLRSLAFPRRWSAPYGNAALLETSESDCRCSRLLRRTRVLISPLVLHGEGGMRCALGLCRQPRAVTGKTNLLPTSQSPKPIAALGLLRRTLSPRCAAKIILEPFIYFPSLLSLCADA